jgi:predicted DNA-binding transcriptional regulator AlpA
MSDVTNHDLTLVDPETLEGVEGLPGVISVLSELNPSALIKEKELAKLFGRHPISIRRAVQRGELPRPVRLFGGNIWTAGSLIRHIEHRLAEVAKKAERTAQKIVRLTP